MANNQLPLPIFTPRLIIRDAVRSDMSGWAALYGSLEERRYLNGPLKRTEQDWWEGQQQINADIERPLSIVLHETSEFVGVCGFFTSEQSGEWEIWLLLHSKFWGKGIGTEVISALVEVAFSSLDAQRVIGIIDSANQASLRLFIKLGFSFLREYSDWASWQHRHHIYGVMRPSA